MGKCSIETKYGPIGWKGNLDNLAIGNKGIQLDEGTKDLFSCYFFFIPSSILLNPEGRMSKMIYIMPKGRKGIE